MTPSISTFFSRGISQVRSLGWSLLYWRFIVRPAILLAKPLPCPAEADVEVHVQICKRDWLNAIWTLHSLAHFTQKQFRLVLLHDGWLDRRYWYIRALLSHLFPGAVQYTRADLEPLVANEIEPRSPALAAMWRDGRYFTLPKVIDSYLLRRNARYICLDPDVLFFDRPGELLEALAPGRPTVWNSPPPYAGEPFDGVYCFPIKVLREISPFPMPFPFQIGCGAVGGEYFDFELAERVFSTTEVPDELRFMVDQTLCGLFAAKHGYTPLDHRRYAIVPVECLEGVVARHYYSKTRDLMYVEGIATLVGQREFRSALQNGR